MSFDGSSGSVRNQRRIYVEAQNQSNKKVDGNKILNTILIGILTLFVGFTFTFITSVKIEQATTNQKIDNLATQIYTQDITTLSRIDRLDSKIDNITNILINNKN